MALTDEQMQDLQSVAKKSSNTKNEGDIITVEGKDYEVVRNDWQRQYHTGDISCSC